MAKSKSRRRFRRKNKYNLEQNPGRIPNSSWQTGILEEQFESNLFTEVVPATNIEGVRKVKNLSVMISSIKPSDTVAENASIYWALVYVPEGLAPNFLHDVGDLYQPSQWVLNTGIINTGQTKTRVYTPLSKNLNKGDRIFLVLGSESPQAYLPTISYLVRYAICFN